MKVSLTITYRTGEKEARYFDMTVDIQAEKYFEWIKKAVDGAAQGVIQSYTSKLIVKDSRYITEHDNSGATS